MLPYAPENQAVLLPEVENAQNCAGVCIVFGSRRSVRSRRPYGPIYGGVSVLSLLIGDPKYMENPLRQDLWRAGHAHAGVWLVLALVALVALRYVDEANLSNVMKWLVRGSIPIAAILVPAAFFLSVLSPDATAPNGLIYLAYAGAVVLAVGVLVLGIGLVRRPAQRS